MSYVYFIKPVGRDGPIKIGCSAYVGHRLETLAAWSPFPLEVVTTAPGNYRDEGFLHQCFSEFHLHHEWFESTPALRETIETVKRTGSLSHAKATLVPKGKRPRKPRSKDGSLRFSFTMRITHALKRLRVETPNQVSGFHASREVERIMSAWRRNLTTGLFVVPGDADIAILNTFIADPKAHGAVPWHVTRSPKADADQSESAVA